MSRAAAHPKADRLSEAEMDRRADVCRKLLVTAGQLAMEGYAMQGAAQPVAMKGPQDFLTETDGKVEEHIRATLAEAFPEDGFLGEEGGGTGSARMWVVDPIDGTANFMRGIPHFCISIAFVEDGRSEIGGIANPAVGETYFARRGQGATRNGAPIHVSPDASVRPRLCGVRLVAADSEPRVSRQGEPGAGRSAPMCAAPARGRLGSAYVADGRSDAYAELHINSWDCLAGLLLVEEAGGRVNRFLDGDGMAKGNPVLAAAPGVAATLSQVIGVPLDDG